ncbi:MAG: WecB/TagA/CpsF family glycosyltransferase [Patescibacteria group bacterium]
MLEKKFILGVGITNSTMDEILEYIIRGLEKDSKKYVIVTPNPEILTLANNDFSYKKILNKAEIALADGVGVIMASKILGRSIKARATGVDLLENLCRQVAEKPITVGFLGAKDKIAEKTAECLRKKYPGLKVAFAASEWPRDSSMYHVSSIKYKEKKQSFEEIHNTKYIMQNTDILFVAFGAPKQERWISENLDCLPVKVAIGVGGAFDYISGKIPRAPRFIREIGFEWLFRLIVQPWRIKRQIALLEFICLVLKERFS